VKQRLEGTSFFCAEITREIDEMYEAGVDGFDATDDGAQAR
jgi:hypothetical protein